MLAIIIDFGNEEQLCLNPSSQLLQGFTVFFFSKSLNVNWSILENYVGDTLRKLKQMIIWKIDYLVASPVDFQERKSGKSKNPDILDHFLEEKYFLIHEIFGICISGESFPPTNDNISCSVLQDERDCKSRSTCMDRM